MLWRRGFHASAKARASHAFAEPLAEPQTRVRTFDEMPAPQGLPVIGTTLSFILAGSAPRLHEYVDRRHQQLGPIFKDTIGPVTAVFVADPTEMRRIFGFEGKYPIHILPEPWILYNRLYGCKRGLFFMDGEEWLRTRRVMNQLMMKPDVADVFYAPCKLTADSLVSCWKRSNAAVVCNLEEQLYLWSLHTIVASLVGSQYRALSPRWRSHLESLSSNVHHIFLESGRMSIISAKYARALNLPVWKRFVHSVDTCLREARALVHQMTESCTTEPQDGLLAQLLEAELSEEDVTKIVVDLIIAAGDTTALSLQWALYLLAKNTDVQEEVFRDTMEQEDETQSPLLRGVVREALRLYPVAPFLTRIMPDSCAIGGFKLPPMQIVLLSLFTSGRDSSNFPEPERFWPARWTRKQENNHGKPNSGTYTAVTNPHASLPFAMGARSCVGRKLAEIQMTTTIAAILKSFQLELLNRGEIEMVLRLVAVPSKPIMLGLKPRN